MRHASYMVEFAADGSMKSKVTLELDPYAEVWHLAVFNSGEYLLVGGTAVATKTGIKDERTPFTAIFASDGHFLKKIYEPEDEASRQKGGGNEIPGSPIDNSNNFVLAGDVTAGSDGNAYLLRGGYPALVYVISPKGNVLRKLQIDAGRPDLVATSIKFYDGRLAIGFDSNPDFPRNLIKVVDLKGNSIADYTVEQPKSEPDRILACYGPSGFTMIPRCVEAKLHLLTVKLP